MGYLQQQPATMGILKRAPRAPTQISYPEPQSELQFNPPAEVSAEKRNRAFSFIPNRKIKLKQDTNEWYIAPANDELQSQTNSYLSGILFIESDDGVHRKPKNYTGEEATSELPLVSDVTVRITKLKQIWHGEENINHDDIYSCELCFPDGNRELIEVNKNNYKNLYKIIRQQYPKAFSSYRDPDAVDEYLSKVFQRDILNAPCEVFSAKIGWMNINGRTTYYNGFDEFYRYHVIPDVSSLNKAEVFRQGNMFLEIGHYNTQIMILWLFAHTPYSLYWFKQAERNFQSVMFLRGKSGTFKTSVTSVLANIFSKKAEKTTIRLSSTRASLQNYIVHLRDNLICVDDFSNTVGAKNNDMVENAEFIIRAVGDGIFPSKMSKTNLNKVKSDNVRCSIIMTGETDFGLSTSSLYRILTVSVNENSFDGSRLTPFQMEPLILQRYFALFIQFLTEHGYSLVPLLRAKFKEYREDFAQQFSVRRFIDLASNLLLQRDILSAFAQYCGTQINNDLFYEAILSIVQLNQELSTNALKHLPDWQSYSGLNTNQLVQSRIPTYIQFIRAFMKVGEGHLAVNEDAYVGNEQNFIGFNESSTNYIWLRFDDTLTLVSAYLQSCDEFWNVNAKYLKRDLLANQISVGKLSPEGSAGSEYLCRAKKGRRERMLVLKRDEVQKIINDEEEH